MKNNLIVNQELKKHIWPLKKEEFNQLEQNILSEGIRDKIVVWDNIIIDGHNRFEIAKKHNLDFEIDTMEFNDIEEVKDWMDANQLGRRNLTEDQWQISIGRRYNREKKKQGAEPGGRGNQYVVKDQIDTLPTADRLADEYKVSSPTVKRYAKKATEYDTMEEENPTMAEAIWSGEKSFKEIKKEEKKEQFEEKIKQQKDDIATGKMQLPEGVFEVIVLDPPWDYGRDYDPESSRVANPYPEMSQEELLKLNPPFSSDSIIFLWTTHQFIWNAKELLDKWGFTYKATMVWDKEKIGMGAWVRMQCEFCLIGIKGKPIWNNTKWRDIIRESRREHSRKPDVFYQMVDEITVGRKLDFFSREKREGWESYGNDTKKF